MLFYFPVLSNPCAMARWGMLRYIPAEIPAPRGKSISGRAFFFSVLFCFVFAQSKCCTGVSPGSHRFQLIPDHRWRPHFLGTSFPRELSLCWTHFCVLAHSTPSLAPSQSQGIVSPLSPIDFFFFPPMENFLCIKWQRKCLIKEEQPDLAVLQDRRWLFSI